LAQKLLTILTFGLVRPKPGVPPGSVRPAPGDKERPRPGRADGNPRESKPPASLPPCNPDAVETDRLHIGNLSYDASESDLLELFKGIGKVQSVDIVYNGRTHRSKGFGFVQMMSIADAKRAVTELHGKPFMGRPLNLGPARSRGRDEREADDGQS
jgi:RNA recognition motif-containing protein